MMACGHGWDALAWDADIRKDICGACRREAGTRLLDRLGLTPAPTRASRRCRLATP